MRGNKNTKLLRYKEKTENEKIKIEIAEAQPRSESVSSGNQAANKGETGGNFVKVALSQVDNVGAATAYDGKRVYTIEGNSNDHCKELNYAVGSRCIYGYGKLHFRPINSPLVRQHFAKCPNAYDIMKQLNRDTPADMQNDYLMGMDTTKEGKVEARMNVSAFVV